MKPLQIEAPCHVDWNAMEGCGARRFCGSCNKSVTDLSALTERQARAVVAQPDVCVRYTVTARGDVRFRRSLGARLLALGAALTPSAAFAGGQPADPGVVSWIAEMVGLKQTRPEPEQVLMGMVAPLQPAAVSLTNATGADVTLTCDGAEQVVLEGATTELTIHGGSVCAVTVGDRTDSLTWEMQPRTCVLAADALTCGSP